MQEDNLQKQNNNYRLSVGMVVFNQAGLVWTGCRIPKTKFEAEPAARLWQFPQGGVDPDEDLLAAAKRELFEETGMVSLEFLQVMDEWLYYDLPAEMTKFLWDGAYCGQKQKWFAFKFTGDEKEINIEGESPEFSDWQWRNLADCQELVVSFKQDVYREVIAAFSHLTALR